MRTITTTTNVYKFEELSPESQANALDKYRDWMTDDPYWYTCETEYHKDLLTEQGIVKPEIYFSGFWSQGDGAVFECKEVDLIKLMESLGLQDKYELVYSFIKSEQLSVSVSIDRLPSMYSHENTAKFYLDVDELYNDDDLAEEDYQVLQEQVYGWIDEIRATIEQWRLDTCREIYQALEDEYTLLQSDDVLKETFIENEYEFTEDGTMYN